MTKETAATKKFNQVVYMLDAMETKILCTNCQKSFAVQDKEEEIDEFIDRLIDDGWKGTENNIYCPDCAKTFKLK